MFEALYLRDDEENPHQDKVLKVVYQLIRNELSEEDYQVFRKGVTLIYQDHLDQFLALRDSTTNHICRHMRDYPEDIISTETLQEFELISDSLEEILRNRLKAAEQIALSEHNNPDLLKEQALVFEDSLETLFETQARWTEFIQKFQLKPDVEL